MKRSINDEHGRFAGRSGATLPLAEVYADTARSYDIRGMRAKTGL